MDISVLVVVISVLTAICGWAVSRVVSLNQIINTQRDTIDELKRQVDSLTMIGIVTEKVLDSLPVPRTGGKKR